MTNPSLLNGRVLDVVDIGAFELTQRGLSIGVGISKHLAPNTTLSASILHTGSKLEAKGKASSPVLGYLAASFIPIVHRFDAASSITFPVWSYHLSWKHHTGNRFQYQADIGFMRTRLHLSTKGNALMGFGITTKPYLNDMRPTVSILDFSCAAELRLLSSLYLTGRISQLVPRIDPQSDTASNRRERGGTSFHIAMRFIFN